MAEVLQHSASYVFILALGYFLKRVGVFGKQDYKVLTQVVLCITLPEQPANNTPNNKNSIVLFIYPFIKTISKLYFFPK